MAQEAAADPRSRFQRHFDEHHPETLSERTYHHIPPSQMDGYKKPRTRAQIQEFFNQKGHEVKGPYQDLLKADFTRKSRNYNGKPHKTDDLRQGMDELAQIVVHLKRDIRRIANAQSLNGAKMVAKKFDKIYGEGHHARNDIDIDHDDIPEITVHDKDGEIVVLNGYTTKPSQWGIRQQYYEAQNDNLDERGRPKTKFNDWYRHTMGYNDPDELYAGANPFVVPSGYIKRKDIARDSIGGKAMNYGSRVPIPRKMTPIQAFGEIFKRVKALLPDIKWGQGYLRTLHMLWDKIVIHNMGVELGIPNKIRMAEFKRLPLFKAICEDLLTEFWTYKPVVMKRIVQELPKIINQLCREGHMDTQYRDYKISKTAQIQFAQIAGVQDYSEIPTVSDEQIQSAINTLVEGVTRVREAYSGLRE